VLASASALSTATHASLGLIEYYGDSTVWGYASGSDGAQVARPAPQVFAKSLPSWARYAVRNHGVSGSSACELLNGTDGRHPHWSEQMALSSARFVILNHAINDQWRYDVPTYQGCLRALAGIARDSGKQVVFETPNPTRDSGLVAYVTAMKEVAARKGLPVIDQYAYLSGLFKGRSQEQITPDGLHPSEAVYQLKGMFAARAFACWLRPERLY
jgi:lysophospholipase L1-like esterase